MVQEDIYERTIDIKTLFDIIVLKIKSIIIVGLIFLLVLAGFKYISLSSAMNSNRPINGYKGNAKIYVAPSADLNFANTISTYITGNEVLQSVINDLNLDMTYDQLYSMINLQNNPVNVITISVGGNDKNLVQNITDKLATIGVQKATEKFSNNQITLLDSANTQQSIYYKYPNAIQYNLNQLIKTVIKYAILGFILGICLMIGIYLVLYIISDTINNENDIEVYLGLPVLGVIPTINGRKRYVMKEKKKKKLRLSQYTI